MKFSAICRYGSCGRNLEKCHVPSVLVFSQIQTVILRRECGQCILSPKVYMKSLGKGIRIERRGVFLFGLHILSCRLLPPCDARLLTCTTETSFNATLCCFGCLANHSSETLLRNTLSESPKAGKPRLTGCGFIELSSHTS